MVSAALVCLSVCIVCLSVSNVTQKYINGLRWNFREMSGLVKEQSK